MHCITFVFSQCFMHYRCVFICWNLCVVRIGLGWTHNAIFFARHILMHCSCIHTFSFPYLIISVDGAFLSLSLSLIVYAWHPSAKPLHLETLFIPRHLLLIPLLFTFGSMMRRHVGTSRRTSPNVAFIRNATWFYQTFLILLYPLSFTGGDGNLCVRYSWVVPPWSYRSSTPICTVLITLYLDLLRRFEVYVS